MKITLCNISLLVVISDLDCSIGQMYVQVMSFPVVTINLSSNLWNWRKHSIEFLKTCCGGLGGSQEVVSGLCESFNQCMKIQLLS